MKGKPIEPGCLALVVGECARSNSGRVVRVIRKMHEPYFSTPNMPSIMRDFGGVPVFGWWLCEALPNTPELTCHLITHDDGKVHGTWKERVRPFPPKCLIRIDGDEVPDEVATRELDTV